LEVILTKQGFFVKLKIQLNVYLFFYTLYVVVSGGSEGSHPLARWEEKDKRESYFGK
jgi:hypothetical protein